MMHEKVLKLIHLNEQDMAEACRWYRETPEAVKCHIWECIQEMMNSDGSEEEQVLRLIGKFAELGMALVAERVYSGE